MRTLVATGVAIALATGMPAHAGPRAACLLVTDARGDANENPVLGGTPVSSPVPSAPAADVLSADLASDRRYLTGVIRLAGAPAPDQQSPAGYLYELRFTIGEQQLAMYAVSSVDGDEFSVGSASGVVNLPTPTDGSEKVTGKFDLERRQVLVHVPLRLLQQYLPTGLANARANEPAVYSYRSAGARATGSFTVVLDITPKGTTYRFGAPSCIAAGPRP